MGSCPDTDIDPFFFPVNIVNPFHFSFSVLDVLEEQRAHKYYSFTERSVFIA